MRVHGSQAYRKMDVTREHISHSLELREVLLSFQTGFNLVSTAVVCAILESILGLEPSSVITEPMYMKFVTVSSFCPFTFNSVLMITATPNFRQVKAQSCTDVIISVFDPQPFHLFSLHFWGKKVPTPQRRSNFWSDRSFDSSTIMLQLISICFI